MTTYTDPYASSQETTEGRVYSVTGGDWDALVTEIGATKEERVVLNMGPQHPSTHGVLRLILELEGETVTELDVELDIYILALRKILNLETGPKA